MRKLKLIYLVLFLGVLFVPLAFINTEENVQSQLDNRKLVEFPDKDDTGYEKTIEKYLQDRIGFRDTIVTGYQLFNSAIGKELTQTYTNVQDGYVFFHMHNNIPYGDYHKTFAEAVLKMQEYCESRGSKFYFLFNPEKISVYRRYLPVGVNYNDDWVDEMLAYMKELGVHYVSNKDLLMNLSYDEVVYNQKYDAGHWNDLGAFYGTNNLWKRIGEDYPSVTEYSLDEWDVSTIQSKYYANSRFPVDEEVPAFTLKTNWSDITKKYTGLNMNKNYKSFRYYVNESKQAYQYPRLLVFQGSFYNSRSQFLVGRTREYIGVHDYQNVLNLDYYYNIFQPEIVVFEVAEYTFKDEYFDSNKMKSLTFNPAIDSDKLINTDNEPEGQIAIAQTIKCGVVEGDGFDRIYLDRGLYSAKYVYLISEDYVFDLQLDTYGVYSTGVPHNAIKNTAILYYEDYEGNKYQTVVDVQKAEEYPDKLTYTDGASYNNKTNKYVFKTGVADNNFSAVNLQLIDMMSRKYVGQIATKKNAGDCTGSFIHKAESGWYIIRMKANSNKQDEGMDLIAYLQKGKTYFYSFHIDKLGKKRITVDEYKVYGMCPWTLNEQELFADFQITTGTVETEEGKYELITDVEGNRFSSVIYQLRSHDNAKFIDPFVANNTAGEYKGYYVHNSPTGTYWLKLRANSNMKDECLEASIELQEGMLYEYSFELESITPEKVIVKNPSFKSVGY